jgi:hypothetical protein
MHTDMIFVMMSIDIAYVVKCSLRYKTTGQATKGSASMPAWEAKMAMTATLKPTCRDMAQGRGVDA